MLRLKQPALLPKDQPLLSPSLPSSPSRIPNIGDSDSSAVAKVIRHRVKCNNLRGRLLPQTGATYG